MSTQTDPRPSTGAHLDSLTGLRIVAAALVFLSHAPRPTWVDGRIGTFFSAGYNGVTLFFVLSGFVIAWNYTERLARPSGRALWSYAVARVARIYPLYLFALCFAAAPAALTGTLPEGAWLHVAALQTWSHDVLFAYALNGPGWSIGVEFFLYACFPLLILLIAPLRRRPDALLTVAVGAVLALAAVTWWFVQTGRGDLPFTDAQSAHRWLYRTPALRLGDFVVGICAALLARRVRVRPWVAAVVQAVSAVALVVLMCSASLLNSAWSWDVAYLVPAALLIWSLAVGGSSRLARVLSARPVVLAGEASFAFYLLHVPLMGRFSIGVPDDALAFALTTLLVFVMILMTSVGAHVVIERPAQRWIRSHLDRSPGARRRAVVVAPPEPLAAHPETLPGRSV